MTPTVNIGLNDMNVVLRGIEQLTVIVAVLYIANLLLHKKNLIPAKHKNLVLLVVGCWALAVALQYVISTHNYIHNTRPFQQQIQQQSQGL